MFRRSFRIETLISRLYECLEIVAGQTKNVNRWKICRIQLQEFPEGERLVGLFDLRINFDTKFDCMKFPVANAERIIAFEKVLGTNGFEVYWVVTEGRSYQDNIHLTEQVLFKKHGGPNPNTYHFHTGPENFC